MNTSSSNEFLIVILAFISAAGILVGLISWAVVLSAGFRRVVEAEKIIASQESDQYRNLSAWGTSFVGRMVRVVNMASFLFWRRFPGYGIWVASRIGDPNAKVPANTQAWIMIPFTLFISSGVTFMVCGGLAKWLDTGALF